VTVRRKKEKCSGKKRGWGRVVAAQGSQKREETREGREGHDRALNCGGEVAAGKHPRAPWRVEKGTAGRSYGGGQG
jgi:hypothetical protein